MLASRLQAGRMGSHGPTCGCPFCVTWGRLHFFITHPLRDPRILEVGVARLRVLYSQVVDLAEGFAPAPEILGQPFIPDPGLPPRVGTGTAGGGLPGAPPVSTGPAEELKATTAKSKAVPPGPKEGEACPVQPEEKKPLKEGLATTKEKERPSTSRPRGSTDKAAPKAREKEEDRQERPRRSDRDRRRSRSARDRDRKRHRRTRTPSRKRSRSRRRGHEIRNQCLPRLGGRKRQPP